MFAIVISGFSQVQMMCDGILHGGEHNVWDFESGLRHCLRFKDGVRALLRGRW